MLQAKVIREVGRKENQRVKEAKKVKAMSIPLQIAKRVIKQMRY